MDNEFLLRLIRNARTASQTGGNRLIDIAMGLLSGGRADAKGGSYTSQPDAWITLENGEHVPLDASGKAMGGAGGWATGKDFSYAMTEQKRKEWTAQGWTPELEEGKTREAPVSPEVQRERVNDCKRRLNGMAFQLQGNLEKKRQQQRHIFSMEATLDRAEKELESDRRKLKRAESDVAKLEAQYPGTDQERENRKRETINRLYDLKDELFRAVSEHGADSDTVRDIREKMEAATNEANDLIRLGKRKWEKDALKRTVEAAERDNETFRQDIEKEKKALAESGFGEASAEYDRIAKERDAAILKALPSIDKCQTAEDVTDYLRARGYFSSGADRFESDANVNLNNATPDRAIAIGKHAEAMMEDYPALKGRLVGLVCGPKDENTYACHSRDTGIITFNDMWYAENSDRLEKAIQKNVDEKFHPPGTTPESVVDHEATHALERMLNEKLKEAGDDRRGADIVMEMVQKRMFGKYRKKDENAVRRAVCRYARENQGVRIIGDKETSEKFSESSGYGRNTEWLAESIQEARGADEPREIAVLARECFEELLRENGII